MSRLQTGALQLVLRDGRARRGRAGRGSAGLSQADRVEVDVARDAAARRTPTPRCSSGRSPTSSRTPCAWSPPDGRGARRSVRRRSDRVDLRVVDRGPGHPVVAARAGVPAVPAAGRPLQRQRGGARARRGARLRRGDGRRAARRGHPRRRRHHGHQLARRRHDAACWSSTTSRRSCARSASTCAPAATTSTSRPTASTRSTLAGRPPPRRGGARPRAARHRRRRGDPRPARLEHGADHRAVGARRRARQGRRPRRRRRRLRHQAVRHGRAAGPPPGRAAPGHPGRGGAGGRDRRLHHRPRRQARRPRRHARCGSRRPSGTWSRCWCGTRASWCRSGSCCRRCGAPSTTTRPPTCGCTWPTSAASSNPTRAGPRYFFTEPGMGYRFETSS